MFFTKKIVTVRVSMYWKERKNNMKTLILSFSNNIVDEDSFIPNKKGLTLSCVEVCEEELKKYEPAIEVEQAEADIKARDLTDLTDLLFNMTAQNNVTK